MDKLGKENLDVRTLYDLNFFQGETPKTAEWIIEIAEFFELRPGEALVRTNQHNDFLYLVLNGLFRVELEAETNQIVTHIARGECVGELSVLDGKPTAATVIADERSQVLAIHRIALWELIDRSPVVARNLLYMLVNRIRKDDEVLTDSLALQRQYAHTARMDSLTGLYNRHWMDEMLPRLIERAETDTQPLGMLMLDVDHFKHYNDTYGHQAGDEVLRLLGSIVLRHIRADDSAIRYGGEEFLIVLPGLDRAKVIEIAERLCTAVRQESTAVFKSQALPGITISIGVAMLEQEQRGNELLAKADHALYQAKSQGRDQVVIG